MEELLQEFDENLDDILRTISNKSNFTDIAGRVRGNVRELMEEYCEKLEVKKDKEVNSLINSHYQLNKSEKAWQEYFIKGIEASVESGQEVSEVANLADEALEEFNKRFPGGE